jgi:hypothetical protein
MTVAVHSVGWLAATVSGEQLTVVRVGREPPTFTVVIPLLPAWVESPP